MDYLLDLVEATRRDGRVRLGASPRAALSLENAIRAHAWVQGRDYCVPEDVKALAIPVLAHRLLTSGLGDGPGRAPVEQIVEDMLDRVAVPT